jgi:hypothetical protein
MSNVALFGGSNVPAFVKSRGELSAVAKALAGGGGAAGGKRISIKGGVFRLMSSGKEVAAIDERYLDVVIVNAAPKVSRTFYMASYDADKVSAPDCWSADGVTPAADANNKQSDKCDTCPQNIQGSGNGNSRACRYSQRMAVVLANDIEGDVLQLTLPATSIFGKEDGENRPLQAYARWLSAQNVDPSEVVTRMKFDTKSEAPKLFFKPMRWLTDDEFPVVKKQGASDDAIKAITMTVAKQDGVVSKPVEETIGGKRPAKAAPVAQDEDDEPPAPAPKAKKAKPVVTEEDDEPVVRKEEKKPNAVPAKKSSLVDMIDDWDEQE